LIFWQKKIPPKNTLNNIFSQKLSKTVKLSYFTLKKYFFFHFKQKKIHLYQSCLLLRGVTHKNVNPVTYWEHGI
jgi:hypothetical protein